MNWPDEDIAKFIGTTAPTLRKHYSKELQKMPIIKKGEIDLALHSKAKSGNISAIKEWAKREKICDTAEHFKAGGSDQPEDHPRPAGYNYVGKKDQENAAAKSAGQGTEWGDDLRAPVTIN